MPELKSIIYSFDQPEAGLSINLQILFDSFFRFRGEKPHSLTVSHNVYQAMDSLEYQGIKGRNSVRSRFNVDIIPTEKQNYIWFD